MANKNQNRKKEYMKIAYTFDISAQAGSSKEPTHKLAGKKNLTKQ